MYFPVYALPYVGAAHPPLEVASRGEQIAMETPSAASTRVVVPWVFRENPDKH